MAVDATAAQRQGHGEQDTAWYSVRSGYRSFLLRESKSINGEVIQSSSGHKALNGSPRTAGVTRTYGSFEAFPFQVFIGDST